MDAPCYNDYTEQGTLHDFLTGTTSSRNSCHCPNLPVLDPEIPLFVRCVVLIRKLHPVSYYTHLNRHLASDVKAFNATVGTSYAPEKGASPSNAQLSGLISARLMAHDSWRSLGLDKLTYGGFLEYPHEDGGGQLTYSYICTGAKLLGFLELVGVNDKDQTVVMTAWSEYYHLNVPKGVCDKGVELGTILLERGSVL